MKTPAEAFVALESTERSALLCRGLTWQICSQQTLKRAFGACFFMKFAGAEQNKDLSFLSQFHALRENVTEIF